jgi:hypothetical protein
MFNVNEPWSRLHKSKALSRWLTDNQQVIFDLVAKRQGANTAYARITGGTGRHAQDLAPAFRKPVLSPAEHQRCH